MKRVTFYKLFDLLNRRGIEKQELIKAGVVSSGTMHRLKRNENTTTEVIASLCEYLKADISDITELEDIKDV